MKTIKTAVVVVLLLAVLYGLYTVLNKPEGPTSADSGWPQPGPLQIDNGTPAAPGDFPPMAGRELADRADAGPPEMPGTLPVNMGGEFDPAAHEPFQPAAKGVAKKPPAGPSSAYGGQQGEAAASFTQPDAAPRSLGAKGFADAWKAATRQMNDGRYRQALAGLSMFYDSPDLSPAERQQLLDVLDPLAGKVIYSTEHLLENPHDVRKNEDLYSIARQYNVTWLLLQNINGVAKPDIVLPGTRLKVVRGPFRGDIKLHKGGQGELTVFLDDLYAGRFPVTIGSDQQVRPGQYEVLDKRAGQDYIAPSGQTIPKGHPQNPYGGFWFDIGGGLCIHSSPTAGGPSEHGCIGLSPLDAGDVYGILTVGSKIEIR